MKALIIIALFVAIGCNGCHKEDDRVCERFSLGIFAGYWHDECFKVSGYRQEGPSGFDHLDSGEYSSRKTTRRSR